MNAWSPTTARMAIPLSASSQSSLPADWASGHDGRSGAGVGSAGRANVTTAPSYDAPGKPCLTRSAYPQVGWAVRCGYAAPASFATIVQRPWRNRGRTAGEPDRRKNRMAVRYERFESTALITLDRPGSLNAMNEALTRELRAAWEQFLAEDDARVAVLTGAG